ncbi:amidohydrolase family protein [Burkholderia sp. Tr-20390]|uniref:amidohydrolase family protein n=1 Tax=Burkholderia sp. Tr-20390 TaxID=2703904 RepID=UPI001981657F|nr:amidohydrolase family protein [Burkholderia sp. Tr-20390]MBN3729636.1 amidohydrolase family protein [Burkholderia sp. Tr-20390]
MSQVTGVAELPLVDTHAHIYKSTMPLSKDAWRRVEKPAPVEDFLATLDKHHIPFGVVAAASMFGEYNEYTLQSLRASPRLRGTVIVPPTVDPYILRRMRDDGVVGVRWVWFMQKGLPDLRSAEYRLFLARLADFDMHVQILLGGERLATVLEALAKSPAKVVVDHFGFPDPKLSTRCPGYQAAVRAADNGRTWVKMAAWHRLGESGPQLGAALLASLGTDRVIWGSDWPFVAAHKGYAYAEAVQSFIHAVPDPLQRRQISETALRLYFGH